MEYEVKRQCVILCSAPVKDPEIFLNFDVPKSYVICADGGLDTAVKYGIHPDLVIGDFDSVHCALPKDSEIITLKTEKDDTDTMAAIKEAVKRGYRDFVLLGALGGDRFDHSFANLCALYYLAGKGCRATIADEHTQIFFLAGGKLKLRELKGKTVSVFPFGIGSCTVSYEGLKYPLKEAPLFADDPRGVSNEILEDYAQIWVHSGSALVMVESI